MKERFGVGFSPKWIGQILTDLGFTPQRRCSDGKDAGQRWQGP
ncbi:hypothetical protein [Glycomyces sp. YM15]